MAAFTPISTPLVGQSRIRISASSAIHFPNTTFCLFPPESAFTGCSILTHLIASESTWSFAYRLSFRKERNGPNSRFLSRPVLCILAAMDALSSRDSVSLFFDTYPILFLKAVCAFFTTVPVFVRTTCPSTTSSSP